MTTADRHQLAIAQATLQMHPMMVDVLGGMTRQEAVEVVARLGSGYREIPGAFRVSPVSLT